MCRERAIIMLMGVVIYMLVSDKQTVFEFFLPLL